MRILDIYDPPSEEPGDASPRLHLVPKGPPIVFRRPVDPIAPWYVRLVSTFLGTILTLVGLTLILLTAAFVKEMYDRMDAIDRARAEQRAKVEAERQAAEAAKEKGAILLSMPPDPNAAPAPAASPSAPPAGPQR